MKTAVLDALRSMRVSSDVLTLANAVASGFGEDRLTTAIVAFFDSRSRTLRFSNAGHPPPLLVTRDRHAFIMSGHANLPLGVFAHYRASDVVVEIPSGAIVVFYTDGFTERDRDIVRGEAELVAAARRAYDAPVRAISRSRSPTPCSGRIAGMTMPRSWSWVAGSSLPTVPKHLARYGRQTIRSHRRASPKSRS